MDNSVELTTERIDAIMKEMSVWAHNCRVLNNQMIYSTGETRIAYTQIYNDFLWKLKLRTSRLWFYVSGCNELNPFKDEKDELAPGENTSMLVAPGENRSML